MTPLLYYFSIAIAGVMTPLLYYFSIVMIAGDNSHRGNFVSPEIKKKNVKEYISYPYETSK